MCRTSEKRLAVKRFVVALWMVLALHAAVLAEEQPARRTVGAGGPAPAVSQEVERALVAEDWARVAALIPTAKDAPPSAAARLLKGHACLALNRNNESLELFLSGASPEDRTAWQEWTKAFAGRQGNSAVAHYLLGDAEARQGRWEAAVAAFTRALEIHPNHALALNARGVARAATGEWDGAREDFAAGERTRPLLADVYASRGAYILQRQTDPTKALEYCEQGLKISPEFALALNNRACAKMLLRQWEGAEQDLLAAARLLGPDDSAVKALLAMNLRLLVDKRNEATEVALASIAGIKPGMSLQEKMQRFESLSPGRQQVVADLVGNADRFNGKIAGNPWIPSVQVGLGTQGPYAALEWDVKGPAAFNQKQQGDLLTAIQQKHNLTANPIDNLSAFVLNHTKTYQAFVDPGGVSSAEVGARPVDGGAWRVPVMYGLAYKVAEPHPVPGDHAVNPTGDEQKAPVGGRQEGAHEQSK